MVGTPYTNSFTGKVLVFTADINGNWNLAAILTAGTGASSDNFGYSVGISVSDISWVIMIDIRR